MLLAGAPTIERPRVVEAPDDSKGYLLARLDEVPVRRLSLGARATGPRTLLLPRRSHSGCELPRRRQGSLCTGGGGGQTTPSPPRGGRARGPPRGRRGRR